MHLHCYTVIIFTSGVNVTRLRKLGVVKMSEGGVGEKLFVRFLKANWLVGDNIVTCK
jgi:hypothetical protein